MASRRRTMLARAGALIAGMALAGCLDASNDADDGSPTGTDADGEPRAQRSTLERESSPDVTDDAVRTLVDGNTAFALDCFQELLTESPNENLLVSPYSVSLAIAMTWAGARGETEEEIRSALQYPFDQERLHPAFNALDQTIEQTEPEESDATPFQLSVANAIWGQQGFPFREAYLDTIARNYGAGLQTLDFKSNPEQSRSRINEWVADQTNETIEQLFQKGAITAATRLVLANAVYFKANWKHTFSPETTEDGQFTALDGSTSTVAMMSQTTQFPVAATDGHKLIELPYVGDTVGMVVILPAEGEFESFERSLTPDRLDTLVQALEPASAAITLPRFTDESQFSLKKTLSALGMASAFDPTEADFSGMVESDSAGSLSIDDVVHKTQIAVDEKGTEAAAATGVTMVVSAPSREFEMTVDRPFIYAIRERTTGSVLFLGRVVDANSEQ